MTAPQAGGAGRLSTGLPRPTTAGSALPALLLLLLLGFALRITIAYVLLPESGFSTDIGTFAAWASRLAQVGPGAFYAPDYFVDYPPGYMYVLWLLGSVSTSLRPPAGCRRWSSCRPCWPTSVSPSSSSTSCAAGSARPTGRIGWA